METAIETQSLLLLSTLLVLILPVLSSILSLLTRERYSWLVNANAPILLLVSVIAAVYTLLNGWNTGPLIWGVPWFTIGKTSVVFSVALSNNTMLMMLVVSSVSFLVHLYSTSFMAWDENIRKYFSLLGFFTFAMQGVVLSDNLLVLFVFWELMGFASYMLIGHWTEDVLAGAAAKKAFIVNRIGDLGFLVGILIVWTNAESFSISYLLSNSVGEPWQTAAALCIFFGVMGKSAQFPLSIWLPDAMKGPTPVSALIHAATMVAAGVYLMVKIFPLFTPEALLIVGTIGVVTAIFGSVVALFQFDIKKILAYSTISQLGLMITAVGAGAPDAAFLHLLTHAFFKACLFLSAGSIIQSFQQAQQQSHEHSLDAHDIRNMGGLKDKLPITFLTFAVGAASLAGLPFFSGFISKETILLSIWKGFDQPTSHWIFIASFLCISFLTAMYTFRLFFFVFLAKSKNSIHTKMVESPVIMRVPMIVLAFASLWFVISWNPFDSFFGFMSRPTPDATILTIFSVVWVLAALGVSFLIVRSAKGNSVTILEKGLYVDSGLSDVFSQITGASSRLIIRLDRKVIDQVIHGGAYAYITLAHVTSWFDRIIIDGIVEMFAGIARWIGSISRSFQGGKIQQYIFWVIFTIIIFLIWSLDLI